VDAPLLGLLLAAFGLGLQVVAAWNIDFAHVALIEGRTTVVVPLVGEVDVGLWWNLNFYALFPTGAALMMAGAYLVGRG